MVNYCARLGVKVESRCEHVLDFRLDLRRTMLKGNELSLNDLICVLRFYAVDCSKVLIVFPLVREFHDFFNAKIVSEIPDSKVESKARKL